MGNGDLLIGLSDITINQFISNSGFSSLNKRIQGYGFSAFSLDFDRNSLGVSGKKTTFYIKSADAFCRLCIKSDDKIIGFCIKSEDVYAGQNCKEL